MFLDNISIEIENTSYKLQNLRAKHIKICGSEVLLENIHCMFLDLKVRAGRAVLRNCSIGTLCLSFPENEVESLLEITNSSVVGLWVSNKPKVRDVEIRNTKFARFHFSDQDLRSIGLSRHDFRASNRASYAFLYSWAVDKGSAEVAHIARAEELAQEANAASGVERFLLASWGIFSDFGLSPLRPLLFLVSFTLFTWIFLYYSGVSVTVSDNGLVGWRASLANSDGVTDDIFRALIISIEGLFSPLTIFSFRTLTVPNTVCGVILKLSHGYFSLVMIFLAGFSIRRRFKIPS